MTHDSTTTALPDDPGWLEGETPRSLLARRDLARDRKIAILRQWELDLRERLVAEEESMLASEPMTITLDQVLDALAELGAAPASHPVPTTHG
jgi:hypothetical protein